MIARESCKFHHYLYKLDWRLASTIHVASALRTLVQINKNTMELLLVFFGDNETSTTAVHPEVATATRQARGPA